MKSPPIYEIALHEAGHAVIAILMGQKFRNVNIRAKDDYFGRMLSWTNRKALVAQLRGTGGRFLRKETIERNVRKEVMIVYAGFMVEQRQGIYSPGGMGEDWEVVAFLADIHTGDDSVDFLNECADKVAELIDANWHHITAIADLLVKEITLSGKRVIAVMQAAGYQPFDFKSWEEYKKRCNEYKVQPD